MCETLAGTVVKTGTKIIQTFPRYDKNNRIYIEVHASKTCDKGLCKIGKIVRIRRVQQVKAEL